MAKIAVAGKGGVGKTTFTSVLAHVLAAGNREIYAIDADPSATLGHALGFPSDRLASLSPVVELRDLIQERTGAQPGSSGAYFRLNPRVDDIPARFSIAHRGIHLLVMGTVRGAGAGCVCPENTMLKALVTHLLLRERQTVLMDMVAGLEHLGRGTAGAVDTMYIVVEPGARSIVVAHEIARLAQRLSISRILAVANKVRSQADVTQIQTALAPLDMVGWLPLDDGVIEADLQGQTAYDLVPVIAERVTEIARQSALLD